MAEADAEHRHLAHQAGDGVRRAGDRGRVAGAVRQEHPVGLAGEHVGGRVDAGTTSTWQPAPTRWRRIVRLMPKS